jgi:hypothetical protein
VFRPEKALRKQAVTPDEIRRENNFLKQHSEPWKF